MINSIKVLTVINLSPLYYAIGNVDKSLLYTVARFRRCLEEFHPILPGQLESTLSRNLKFLLKTLVFCLIIEDLLIYWDLGYLSTF